MGAGGVLLDDSGQRVQGLPERLVGFGAHGLGGLVLGGLPGGIAGRGRHLGLLLQAVLKGLLGRGDLDQVEADRLLDVEAVLLFCRADLRQNVIGLPKPRDGLLDERVLPQGRLGEQRPAGGQGIGLGDHQRDRDSGRVVPSRLFQRLAGRAVLALA